MERYWADRRVFWAKVQDSRALYLAENNPIKRAILKRKYRNHRRQYEAYCGGVVGK